MLLQPFAFICVRSSLWHTISRQKEDPEAPGVRSEGELWGMRRTGLSRGKTWGLGWYSKDRAGQDDCLYVEGGKGNLKQVRVVGEAVPAWALGSPGAWQSRRPGIHGSKKHSCSLVRSSKIFKDVSRVYTDKHAEMNGFLSSFWGHHWPESLLVPTDRMFKV